LRNVAKLEGINVSEKSHMLGCFRMFRIKKVCRLDRFPSRNVLAEAMYRLQMLRK